MTDQPTFGIPDPGGPSGTFAALERTTPIVQAGSDGTPTTTSIRVANGTQNEHASVLRLIRDNLADFEEFGLVGFEIQPRPAGQHGGGDVQIAILNEEHATLLLTYMRNNEIVKDFKKRLVREFSALRKSAVMPTHSEALRGWAEQLERAEAAESRVRELAPAASSWNELAEASGDYSVADAAKVLSRDPNISTGERRLFQEMAAKSWIFRREGRWRAYQSQVDCGRLVEKVNKPYVRNGEMVTPDPTIRITPKGLAALHEILGGGEQLALIAGVS